MSSIAPGVVSVSSTVLNPASTRHSMADSALGRVSSRNTGITRSASNFSAVKFMFFRLQKPLPWVGALRNPTAAAGAIV
jgi:hypothetical protein